MTRHRDELTFLEFFQSFRRGDLVAHCDRLLSEVMEAIRDTGGKGSITIKLPFAVNKAGQIECTPDVKAERPRRALGSGIYYVTDDGRLTRRDPAQLDMMDELEPRRGRAAADD